MDFWWLCAAVIGCVYFIILFTVVWKKVFQKAPKGYGWEDIGDTDILTYRWNRVFRIGAMFVVLVIEIAFLNMVEVTFWRGLLLVFICAFSVIFKWLLVLIVKLIALFFYFLYWGKD